MLKDQVGKDKVGGAGFNRIEAGPVGQMKSGITWTPVGRLFEHPTGNIESVHRANFRSDRPRKPADSTADLDDGIAPGRGISDPRFNLAPDALARGPERANIRLMIIHE